MSARIRARSFLFILFTGCVLMLGNAVPAQAQPADKIKELLKERVVVATKIAELTMKAFKAAAPEIRLDHVIAAQEAVLKVKLDLCDTKAERIKVHEEIVKLAEESLDIAEKLAKAAAISAIDLLKAKAHLLDARIGLERAKAAK